MNDFTKECPVEITKADIMCGFAHIPEYYMPLVFRQLTKKEKFVLFLSNAKDAAIDILIRTLFSIAMGGAFLMIAFCAGKSFKLGFSS